MENDKGKGTKETECQGRVDQLLRGENTVTKRVVEGWALKPIFANLQLLPVNPRHR